MPAHDEQSESVRKAELISEAMGFYGRDVSHFQMRVWLEALKPYSADDVQAALSRHVQDPDRGQYQPKPADITRMLHGGGGDRSLRAWSQVERAIRQIGPYTTVVFDDPAIHAVIEEMGGWVRLCEAESAKDLEIRGHEFRRRHQGYALRGPDRWPPTLPGIVERDNRAAGFEAPEPRLLGNPDKARLVYQQGSAGAIEAQPLSRVLEQAGASALCPTGSD